MSCISNSTVVVVAKNSLSILARCSVRTAFVSGFHDHSLHSQASHASHSDHEMKMWFHGGWDEVILFEFWRISSFSGLILSFIAIFVMGAIYEGIKWFRVYLQMISSTSEFVSNESGIRLRKISHDEVLQGLELVQNSPAIFCSPFTHAHACSSMRLLEAFLYVVQLVLAYWLMLIVMTYNTWLTMAVIGGAGFGHWLFAVIKFRNPESETADTFATDACH
uniref:Copper transport protein n=1 Tax=Angiostrongylus cantonensis TaxID=6313 RepID=A0A158P866_ANGCA